MWHLLYLIATALGFLLGLFCVLTAIFLYPGEQGKIQSTFEDFWVRVDDYQKRALSKHAAFMTEVAKLESRFIDRVFGEGAFSTRAIGIAYVAALGSITAWLGYHGGISHNAVVNLLTFFGFLVMALALIFLRWKWMSRVLLVVLIVFSGIIALAIRNNWRETSLFIVLVYFSANLVIWINTGFIALTRSVLRWAGEMTSTARVLIVVALNMLLSMVLIGPLLLNIAVRNESTFHKAARESLRPFTVLALTNLLNAFLAISFAFLAAILLLHRLIWPILVRSLFQMQDIGVKGRRGILMAVGFALLVWSGVYNPPDWVKEVLKVLVKG